LTLVFMMPKIYSSLDDYLFPSQCRASLGLIIKTKFNHGDKENLD
jgi:hypothetical protein